MLPAAQQFTRFRCAKKLADVAKLEGPMWSQAITRDSGVCGGQPIELEAILGPKLPIAPFDMPTINGRPLIFHRPGELRFQILFFGLN